MDLVGDWTRNVHLECIPSFNQAGNGNRRNPRIITCHSYGESHGFLCKPHTCLVCRTREIAKKPEVHHQIFYAKTFSGLGGCRSRRVRHGSRNAVTAPYRVRGSRILTR